MMIDTLAPATSTTAAALMAIVEQIRTAKTAIIAHANASASDLETATVPDGTNNATPATKTTAIAAAMIVMTAVMTGAMRGGMIVATGVTKRIP